MHTWLPTELRSFLAENSKGGRDGGAGNVFESGVSPAYHVPGGGAGSVARKGAGEIGAGRADGAEDGEDPVYLISARALYRVHPCCVFDLHFWVAEDISFIHKRLTVLRLLRFPALVTGGSSDESPRVT
jgi:hypothetical protein